MSAPTNAATAAASAPNVTKPPNSAAVATSTTANTSATASHTIATGITSYSENAQLSFSVVERGMETRNGEFGDDAGRDARSRRGRAGCAPGHGGPRRSSPPGAVLLRGRWGRALLCRGREAKAERASAAAPERG